MKLVVGTSPVKIDRAGRGRLVLQNLGPGTVYFDTSADDVTVDSGLRLDVGAAYEFSGGSGSEDGVSVVSTAEDTDVRVIVMGERG
jgi:hypothetical protein